MRLVHGQRIVRRDVVGDDGARLQRHRGLAAEFEFVLDDHLGDTIARNPSVTEFRRTCAERGMFSLREDGFRKVAKGVTTVEEVLRVTESTI